MRDPSATARAFTTVAIMVVQSIGFPSAMEGGRGAAAKGPPLGGTATGLRILDGRRIGGGELAHELSMG